MPDYWPLHSPDGHEFMTLALNGTTLIGRGPRLRQCALWGKHLRNLAAGNFVQGSLSAESNRTFNHQIVSYLDLDTAMGPPQWCKCPEVKEVQ